MAPPFSSSDYNTQIIDSSQLIDRTIKGIDIGLGTIELNNLSASAIASLSGGGGAIADNSIQNVKLFDKTIENTKIADGTITTSLLDSNLSIENLLVSNDLEVTNNLQVMNTITVHNGITVAVGNVDISNGNLTLAGNLYANNIFAANVFTGVFEITCNTNFTADFYYVEDYENIYLFQGQLINSGGNQTYILYPSLPYNFAITTFFLESEDEPISSYSLTYASPTNGIINHSLVGTEKIQFNILRNSQHYLELDIYINI